MDGNVDSPGNPADLPSGVVSLEEERPINLGESFQLGILLEHLRKAARHNVHCTVGGNNEDGINLIDTLERLEDILSTRELETPVTAQVANYRSNLDEKYEEPGDSLDEGDRQELEQKSITWQHLLGEALGREQRIPVDNTGILDVDRLVETPEDMFSSHVWNWLDDRPKSDIREACKTIVVGCSTSSVMLSLRAVEHCLRQWHEKEDESIEAAWGQVLDRLMDEYAEEDRSNDSVLTQLSDLPPVLSNLYYLKEKRNEVNHPEKSPNPQEARRTLLIVASTISDIYWEIYEDRMSQIREAEEVNVDGLGKVDLSQIHQYDEPVNVFNKLTQQIDEGDGVQREAIIELGSHLGFTAREVHDILQDLLMDGEGYEPEPNRYKPI